MGTTTTTEEPFEYEDDYDLEEEEDEYADELVDAIVEGVVEDILEEEREDKEREEAISNTRLLPVRGSNLRVSSPRGSSRSGVRKSSPKFPQRFSRPPRHFSQEERSETNASSKSSG